MSTHVQDLIINKYYEVGLIPSSARRINPEINLYVPNKSL